MANKTCPRCKTELAPEYAFCPECGTRLVAPESGDSADPLSSEAPSQPAASAPKPAAEATVREPAPAPAARAAEGAPKAARAEAKSSGRPRRFRIVRMARGGGQRAEYDVPDRGLVVGRIKADLTFPDDETVSPRHATIRPAGDHIEVEDAGSLNGLFVRIKGEHRLTEGDAFLCGDQVFRVSLRPGRFHAMDWGLYAAPQEPRVVATLIHILPDGVDGTVHAVRALPFVIGREEGSILFGTDRFMSRKHAAIQQSASGLVLVDLKSRNGTYLCRRGQISLGEGDIFMVGRQILRIETVAQ